MDQNVSIEVIYRPETLAYGEFCVTANQCFPHEPFNIGLFNEMQLNHFWILQSDTEIIGYTHVKEENDHLHLSAIGIVPGEHFDFYRSCAQGHLRKAQFQMQLRACRYGIEGRIEPKP